MRRVSLAVSLLLALQLPACGFHLAGARPMGELLQQVRIDVDARYQVSEPPIETSLRARLVQRGGTVVERDGDDVTLIALSNLDETREVLSLDPEGKALEFLLTTRVRYAVSRNGETLLPFTEVSVSRDYSFDQEQVLAKEAEEERLLRFMQQELAELVLLQIDARLASLP
jgi:LPS-assembly lipoprotein